MISRTAALIALSAAVWEGEARTFAGASSASRVSIEATGVELP